MILFFYQSWAKFYFTGQLSDRYENRHSYVVLGADQEYLIHFLGWRLVGELWPVKDDVFPIENNWNILIIVMIYYIIVNEYKPYLT